MNDISSKFINAFLKKYTKKDLFSQFHWKCSVKYGSFYIVNLNPKTAFQFNSQLKEHTILILEQIENEWHIRQNSGGLSMMDNLFEYSQEYLDNTKLGGSIINEVVSANPVGPLHAGNVLLTISANILDNLLRRIYSQVTSMYYVNDLGNGVLSRILSISENCSNFLSIDEVTNFLDTYSSTLQLKGISAEDTDHLDQISLVRALERNQDNSKQYAQLNLIRRGLVKYNMDLIKKQLTLFNLTIDEYLFESDYTQLSNDFINQKGLMLRRPSDNSLTYQGRDLAMYIQYKLSFKENYNTYGADHTLYVNDFCAYVNKQFKPCMKYTTIPLLYSDGSKMGKRKGNVVDLISILKVYTNEQREAFILNFLKGLLKPKITLEELLDLESPLQTLRSKYTGKLDTLYNTQSYLRLTFMILDFKFKAINVGQLKAFPGLINEFLGLHYKKLNPRNREIYKMYLNTIFNVFS